MNIQARVPFALGTIAASVLATLGCQSILGIDTDRPLDAGLDDAPKLPQDSGNGDGTTADTGGGPIDASEGGVIDAPPDSPYSLQSPLQIDISSLFNANTVVTSATGGAPLMAMDGMGASTNSDFATQHYIDTFFGAGNGLPDTALFQGDGTSIPQTVQLAWSDTKLPAQNSMLVSGTSKNGYTIPVPSGHYSQVQLYATTTGGNTTLSYTHMYDDNSTTTGVIQLSDWCVPVSPLPNGQHVLGGSYRIQNGMSGMDAGTLNTQYTCNIYALDLTAKQTKALVAVTLNYSGTTTSYFVLYGAAAW
jgi:hypothetical protein